MSSSSTNNARRHAEGIKPSKFSSRGLWISVLVVVPVLFFTLPEEKKEEVIGLVYRAKSSVSQSHDTAETETAADYVLVEVSPVHPTEHYTTALSVDTPTKWIVCKGSHQVIRVDPPAGFIIIPDKGEPFSVMPNATGKKIPLGQVMKRPFQVLGVQAGQSVTVTAFW